jgi:uncharacterized protein
MLLSFRFANHRSFRDEQQLNLMPVYEPGNLDEDRELAAVPVAGIFGANASGKSNVISAFQYLSDMVGTSDRESEPGFGPRRQPFRLDPEIAHEPSSYAADFLIRGVRHTYGFILDDDRILEEWLYTYPLKKKRVIFERTGQDFHWGDESSRSSIRKLTDITSHTALFLSVASRFEARRSSEKERDETSTVLHSTYSRLWQRTAWIGTPRTRPPLLYARLFESPERRAAIVDLLKAADVGLQDVYTQPPDQLDDALADSTAERKRTRASNDRRGRLQFLHRGSVGNVSLGTEDESSGTLRLLELASVALSVLELGDTFLVDEIDASLHPLLTASLIRIFQSPKTNTRGAQLVFTTHDATLLGSIDGEDVLDRDQVWFTSKRDDGSSELFPLAEFKPRREGENRQKRYLNGSYGAIPEISMRLFEQAITGRTDSGAEQLGKLQATYWTPTRFQSRDQP